MLKFIILISVLCMPAMAKKKKRSFELDPRAEVISRHTTNSSYFDKKDDALFDCKSRYRTILTNAEDEAQLSVEHGLRYSCKEVVYEAKVDIDKDFRKGGDFFPGLDWRYSIYVNTYCIPRTLKEKQIYALAQRCEQNPQEMCFTEHILNQIDQLALTKFKYIDYNNACSR